MITTDAPAWLRRSDQAVTWARTMLLRDRAVVIDCETTDLPGGVTGNDGYQNLRNRLRATAAWLARSVGTEDLSVPLRDTESKHRPPADAGFMHLRGKRAVSIKPSAICSHFTWAMPHHPGATSHTGASCCGGSGAPFISSASRTSPSSESARLRTDHRRTQRSSAQHRVTGVRPTAVAAHAGRYLAAGTDARHRTCGAVRPGVITGSSTPKAKCT